MRIFTCPACARDIYFHNLTCVCGGEVAFDPGAQGFVLLDAPCPNRTAAGCNWIAGPDGGLCVSCSMTRTIPDLSVPANAAHWVAVESAKRWVLTALMRLGWLTASDDGPRPVFDLMSENTASGPVNVMMGHDEGLIVLNASEADPTVLATRAAALGERYRTMIGHMRHELAHFLHWRLMNDAAFTEGFRALFGDERADYEAALQTHYANPQPPGDAFITSYATAHPHEDWAETTAHLLHLLEIADSFDAAGLSLDGLGDPADPYLSDDTAALLTRSAAQSLALNHVNRAMGLADLYPFVLAGSVQEKLAFVHQHLRR